MRCRGGFGCEIRPPAECGCRTTRHAPAERVILGQRLLPTAHGIEIANSLRMHDRRSRVGGSLLDVEDHRGTGRRDGPGPGKSTLVEQLQWPQEAAPRGAVPASDVDAGAKAEDSMLVAAESYESQAQATLRGASGTQPTNASPPFPLPKYDERDDAPDRAHYAKQDKHYNKEVHNNKKKGSGKGQRNRVGVRYPGKDIYRLKKGISAAPRYLVRSDGGCEQVDVVTPKMALSINPVGHKALDIQLPGARHPSSVDCIFVFAEGYGTAWLPMRFLRGDRKYDDGLRAETKRAARKMPDAASKAQRANAAHYVFAPAGDAIANADAHDDKKFVLENQKTTTRGNRVSDYLQHEVPTHWAGASEGSTSARMRAYYNISMNLPSNTDGDRVAPVAIDTAVPGDSFFVAPDKIFHQEIAIYDPRHKDESRKKARKTTHRQTWVFGHVGKVVNGKVEPDEARRGWVPLRCLKPAP